MLEQIAAHNEWANRKIFGACSSIAPTGLTSVGGGYDSVLGILNHLVQVENAFFELAHGRDPRWTPVEDLDELRTICERIDGAYVEYAHALDPAAADGERFLVPWFDLEITKAEGIVQPLTHSHKHRADVSMLLPALGSEGVEMDYIQWLDELRG